MKKLPPELIWALIGLAGSMLLTLLFVTATRIVDRVLPAKSTTEIPALGAERVAVAGSTTKPKLTARSVKPPAGRERWSQAELEAFDLLNEDRPEASKEAVKMLEEEALEPEPWLIEMRRRLGMTNLYAPVGPKLGEIEEMKP